MIDVRTRVVKGASWTALQKWTVRLSGLVVFAVLSRILGPDAIGLAALGLAVASLFGGIAELSLSAFLVRAEHVDAGLQNTVFWSGLGAASIAGVVLAALADPLGQLLRAPELAPILRLLTPLLLVSALGAVPTAILERGLAFRELAMREMAGAVLSAVVGIAMALSGAGVWSLVGQAWTQGLVSTVLVFALTRWRPGLSFSPQVLRDLVHFGGPLLGVQICQLLRDRGEQVLLGALLGLEALGVWAIATRLLGAVADLTISVLDAIALPVLANARSDLARFQRVHESAVASCGALLTPVLLLLAVGAPAVVPAFFGAAWSAAVTPTQALCLAYAVGSLAYFNRAVLIASGKVRTELALTVISVLVRFGLLVVVAPLGLVPLAWAMVADTALAVLLGAWAVTRSTGLGSALPQRALVTVGCGSAAAAFALTTRLLVELPVVAEAALAGLLGMAVFGCAMWWTNRSLVVDLGRDLRRLTPSPSTR